MAIDTRSTPAAAAATPWLRPGRWLANPTYWHDDARHETAGARPRIGFIDATLSEGDDCVGHQLNWNSRLRLAEALDDIGVDEITLPSHTTYEEERDWTRAYRRRGLKTPIVAKGPGIAPPLRGDWRAPLERHLELEADTVCPIFKWSFHDVLHDFSGELTKQAVVEAIGESVEYLKQQGCRVVPWVIDSMRTRLDTVLEFYAAIIQAGGDGVLFLTQWDFNDRVYWVAAEVRGTAPVINLCAGGSLPSSPRISSLFRRLPHATSPMTEGCDSTLPASSAAASAAAAPAPPTRIWPMCETSKSAAAARQCRCSAMMPAGNCTGMA